MKEIKSVWPSTFIKIALSIVYGLVCGVLVSYQFFRLALRSFSVQCALVFGFSLIFGALVYFIVIPLFGRLTYRIPEKSKIGFILVTLLGCGLMLIYVAYLTTLTPTAHKIIVTYADSASANAAGDPIQLGQLELSKTGIIPLNQILSAQKTGKKDTSGKVTSIPLPVQYTFYNKNDGEMADVLFFVTPPGEKIILQLDQERSYHNLITTRPDQVVISLPVYKRFTPLQILLHAMGICCVVAAIFLLFFSILPFLSVRSKSEPESLTIEKYPLLSTMLAVILAVCFAASIALLFSVMVPEKLGSSVIQNTIQSTSYTASDWKLREKVFYVVFYALGFLFSIFAGSKWVRPMRHPFIVGLAILAWLPVANRTAFLVMQVDPQQYLWLALCILSTVCIALFAYATVSSIRWIGGIAYLLLWLVNGNQSLFYPIKPDLTISIDLLKIILFLLLLVIIFLVIPRLGLNQRTRSLVNTVLALVILFGMIFPASLTYVSADISGDIHAPFHLYAPALFSRFGQGLTPGYEYFTQYGVGTPYLFALLLGDSPQETIYHYILLAVILLLFFYFATYFILKRLFDSDRWALAIVVVSVILQFWSNDKHLGAPSMLVFRYPLFPIILALLIYWAQRKFQALSGILLSLLLGFSIFWTTETGISFLIASCAVIGLVLGLSRRSLVLMLVLCLETIAVFFGLSVIAFGGRVFSMNFIYEGILSPLIIYGSGYGAIPIAWRDGLPYFANLICPVVAVASMGVIFSLNFKKDVITISGPERALLVFCSALTILFSAKYINRAYLQNWHATVLPAVIITAYWLKRLAEGLSTDTHSVVVDLKRSRSFSFHCGQVIVALALVVGFLYLIFTPELETALTVTGLKSYVTYDSMVNRYLGQILPSKSGIEKTYWTKPLISQNDIDLIEKYVKAGDPLMLIGFNPGLEWEYFIAARRLPASPVVPTQVIFSRWQADVFKSNLPEVIFLPYGENIAEHEYIKYPELDEYIKKAVLPEYSFLDKADTLYAYRKR